MSEPYIGEIRMFAGNFAPRGWAFCDGQLLSVTANDALFSLFGTIYGGDGRTTFALPDIRGRIPLHQGSGPGLSPRRLGQKSGSENVTLTNNQLSSHTHDFHANTAEATDTAPQERVLADGGSRRFRNADQNTSMASGSIAEAGASQPHSNLMPAVCVNFIVALMGVYPSRS